MKKPTVKMSLSLDKDFYDLIQNNAKLNYIKPSTWVKQVLMRSILKNDDFDLNQQKEQKNANAYLI